MMGLEYGNGDIVFVPRGQKTNFFEVKEVTETEVVISNGWVQINKIFEDVILICKKENRSDIKNIDFY